MIFNQKERQKILIPWNKSASVTQQPQILSAIFEKQIKNQPRQIALMFEDQTLTYHDLNVRANQIAHFLKKKKIDNKSLVAIAIKPCLDLLVGILAILKAGAAYVPLDINNPDDRQKYILRDTEAKILITHSTEISHFKNTDVELICLDTLQTEIDQYPKDNPKHINQLNDLAYVIYTSGSTGNPKGVMVTHANVNHFISWFSKSLDYSKDDIFDFSSSISFDFAVATTLFPMLCGIQIVICNEIIKRDPYLYLDYLQKNKISIIKITPSHFKQLKQIILGEKNNLNLKYIIFGGETLFIRDIKDWLEQFPKQILFCEYGPTEATVASSWIKVNKNNINEFKNKIPIGKPALNTQLYVLDEEKLPVSVGKIGELYIGGNGVAKGYLHQTKMTTEKFLPDFFTNEQNAKLYKTGDFCRYLDDGNIEFVERLDHQVKIRGYRIEMDEIENYLITHPNIQDAVVIAEDFDHHGVEEKILIAYCVPRDNELDMHALRVYLHNHLPDYMIPTIFETLSELPLSSSGKLDRKKLPPPKLLVNKEEVIPHSELERFIKIIWEEELHLKHINPDDNFFYLGGHSLCAARILSKIRRSLNKNIQLQDFYQVPTITHLSKLIQKADVIAATTLLSQYSGENIKKIPLSELQFLFWLIRLFYPQAKISNITARKRLAGILNVDDLNAAVNLVCKNNPVLSYYLHRYYPLQNMQQLKPAKITTFDIQNLSSEQQEIELLSSYNELQNLSWPKGQYLFAIKLFKLKSHLSELQIGISHYISDEVSAIIFLQNLSENYLAFKYKKNIYNYHNNYQYRDYVLQEHLQVNQDLDKNIRFWEAYLRDVQLISFSQQYVLNTAPHTHYITIPEAILTQIQQYCSQQQLSITECLCAAISSILMPYIQNSNKTIVIHLIKSTRDNHLYDKTIGLFIRTDTIKINGNDSINILQLCKKVQNSIAETSAFQSCPSIVKLGCLLKNKWEKKWLIKIVADVIAKIYTNLFRNCKLDYRVLKMFVLVFFSRGKDKFDINVNITNNFITNNDNEKLFGLDTEMTKPYQNDKTIDKNILNIWFDRDSENKIKLILSGNLQPVLIEQLGQKLIHILANLSNS